MRMPAGLDSQSIDTTRALRQQGALERVGGTVQSTQLVGVADSVGWASWTPSWTNLTVGDGTVTARYVQVGKTVHCRLHVLFGSTTAVSGLPTFSLPVTANAGAQLLGVASLRDDSTSTVYSGEAAFLSTTTAAFAVFTVSGVYLITAAPSATVPFTWAVNDSMFTTFSYEAV